MTKTLHLLILVILTVLPASAIAAVMAVAEAPPFNPFESYGGTTISAVAIGSWTWIFRWMVNQLDLQRQAHAAAQSELIRYMKEDHTLLISTNQQLTAVLTEAVQSLKQVTTATIAAQK